MDNLTVTAPLAQPQVDDTAPNDEGAQAESHAPINFLQLARDADASSSSWFNTNIRRTMQQSLNQFNSKHDEGSKYLTPHFKPRSKYYIPKTRANIRKHEASFAAAYFSTQDVVNVDAYDEDDPTEKAAADYYKSMMNLRLTNSSSKKSIHWFEVSTAAYQDAMIYGLAISRQDWDFKNDKPTIKLIEPENFRFDPACDWINPIETSPFLIEKIPMNIGDIKEKIARGEFLSNITEAQLASARRPETNQVSQARNPERTDPLQRPNSIKDFDIVWVHLNIIKQMGVDWAFYTLGTEAYLSMPVPLEEMFLHGVRPYVLGKCVIEAHKNYSSSLPQMGRDLQNNINDLANQRMDNVRQQMDKRYIVKRGVQVDLDSLVRNAPGSVTLANDPEKDIKVLTTPDVTASSYKEQELLNIAMDDIGGGFNSATMQANRSLNETVGGMTLLSQSANQVAEYQLKTFNESWVEPVLTQILLLEMHYETNNNIIMLAGKNADLVQKYGEISFQDIQMKDLLLSVQVGMGATNPATKLEKLMMALRSLNEAVPQAMQQLNINEVIKEIFGALGFKDGNRFINTDNVDVEKEALKQQVQQLTQELANKRSPVLDAANAKLIEAQAIESQVKSFFASIEGAQLIAKMTAISPIADKIMQDSGYQRPIPAGVDPNLPVPNQPDQSFGVTGALADMARADPNALHLAHQQALAHDNPEMNTDPLAPLTGNPKSPMVGANQGINGGI